MKTFPWNTSRRFNAYSDYIRKKFGGRIQKVAVDAGFTCPNRDGTFATGGCTYCDNEGFNPSYCKPEKSISLQIREGIEFHAQRYRRAEGYLVYFQPFSNTYAPLDVLQEKYSEALAWPGVKGLVIGTRPDCIDDYVLDYLASLAEQYYIQVEFGVETHSDKTLERINRGHNSETSVRAIRKTHERGIITGAHYIFGLPGETLEEMIRLPDILSALPLDTVKFHQLQIVKGTRMEQEFLMHREDFVVFDLEDYIQFIIGITERLRPELVIERFTSEMPPRFLTSHNLGLVRYDEVLRRIETEMERRDTWQGKKVKSEK
ncbi:MAG: TIGR01212 family radical SAM protein [Syntrophothermus sp.]